MGYSALKRTSIRAVGTKRARFIGKVCLPALSFLIASQPSPASEYVLSPSRMDGGKAVAAVHCVTPAGWQGWKDDPRYWDGVTGLNKELLEGAHMLTAFFVQSNCQHGPQCPSLTLDTMGLKPGQRVSVRGELQRFARQVQQHERQRDPDPEVSRFGSFNAGEAGTLTIWQISCSFYNQYFLTMFAQRDVLVTIYLQAQHAKQIVDKLDSLKELARSVRVTEAKFLSPDVIRIDVRHSNNAIRQQLLQLTPVGTSMQKTYEIAESRLQNEQIYPSGTGELVVRTKDALQLQLGNYWDGRSTQEVTSGGMPKESVPALTIVRAFWRFDRNQQLRDIEVRRFVQGR